MPDDRRHELIQVVGMATHTYATTCIHGDTRPFILNVSLMWDFFSEAKVSTSSPLKHNIVSWNPVR